MQFFTEKLVFLHTNNKRGVAANSDKNANNNNKKKALRALHNVICRICSPKLYFFRIVGLFFRNLPNLISKLQKKKEFKI